jgi:aminopeptidase YwaD
MRILTTALLFAFCLTLSSIAGNTTPQALIQFNISDPGLMEKLARLPMTLNYRSDSYIIATIEQQNLQKIQASGFPFTVLEENAWDEPYYIVTSPQGKKLAALPSTATPLLRNENQALVKMQADQIPVVHAAGFKTAQISATPLPWRFRAAQKPAIPQGPDPVIAALVKRVSNGSITAGLQRLQDFQTRYSASDSVYAASQWIFDQFVNYGYTDVSFDTLSFLVERKLQRNVIAIKKGTTYPDSLIVIGGHYDSVVYDGTDANQWAPGVDDNGSGTIAVLEIARILAKIDLKVTVVFACWAAEEQGLYGSTDWVQRASQNNLKIGLNINFDMIANLNQTDPVRDVVVYKDNASQGFADLMSEMARTYTQLIPRQAGAGGGSDHYPFMQYGYFIVYAEEGDFSPNWHMHTDTMDNVNIDYFNEVIRMGLATLVQVAGAPPFVNESFVTFSSYRFNDSGTGQSTGNNNGYLDPGETIELNITIKNIGNAPSQGGSASLVCNDPYVAILQNTLPSSPLNPGDSLTLASPFVFTLDGNIPDKHFITMKMTVSDLSGKSWDNYLLLQALLPELAFKEFSILETDGDHDRAADAGETCNLYISLNNRGSRTARDIVATLTCLDPDITVTDGTASYNPIDQNTSTGNLEDPFRFSIQPGSQPHLVEFKLDISEGLGYYQNSCIFNILLGQKPILLVSDDGDNQNLDAYLSAFQYVGIKSDNWDNLVQGIPPIDTLSAYTSIIWYTGYDGRTSLTADEQSVLKSFLDQGGHLLLSGDFIGYYLRNSTFYANYLHAAFAGAQTQIFYLQSLEDNPVTELSEVSLEQIPYVWPTEIDPVAPAVPILHYDLAAQGNGEIKSSGTAALAVESDNYRIVYCSFQVEAIRDNQVRADFIKDVLQWFNGAPLDVRPILVIENVSTDDDSSGSSDGDGDGFLNPGETIDLSPTIQNKGPLAGQNINLLLRSEDDMAHIIDSTAVISDIQPHSSLPVDDAFVIAIDEQAENNHTIKFDLVMTDGLGRRWNNDFQLTVMVSGSISGTTVDAATGQAVPAHILWNSIVERFNESALTGDIVADQNGDFSLSLPMGIYDIAAYGDGYILTEPVRISVPPDTSLNFFLVSPRLAVTPDSIVVRTDAAGLASDTLIIKNSNTGDLYVSLYENPASANQASGHPPRIYRKGDRLGLALAAPNSAKPLLSQLAPDPAGWKMINSGKTEPSILYDLNEFYAQNTKKDLYLKQNITTQKGLDSGFEYYIFIDADVDISTGLHINDCGADFLILISPGQNYVLRWQPSLHNFDYDPANPFPSYALIDQASQSIETGIPLVQLGNPSRINIVAVILDNSQVISDVEPSYGLLHIPYSTFDFTGMEENSYFKIIGAGQSVQIALAFDTHKLPNDIYNFYLVVESNQAGQSWYSIPVLVDNTQLTVKQESDALPQHYALQQNYPNPFSSELGPNRNTMIKFQLPRDEFVTLKVYNLLGQQVATLVSQDMKAGYHQFQWDGRLSATHAIGSGIYFYRLKAGNYNCTKKMLVVR